MRPTLRRLEPDDWPTWRALRLAALSDSPQAFASSLTREQSYGEGEWRDWLAVHSEPITAAQSIDDIPGR
ncbi:hypothetical protein [Actinoplanes solisilvae]|uniref:hypothetical protein n=1 Tax=Actinoplanes solisilvae TaxID=2486853 RepID=UPI001F0B7887|nr:hypothetical protein [Actinoplanes solisilvae]